MFIHRPYDPETDVEVLDESGKCTVVLTMADMIGVGMSLRALAREGKPNPETAEIFARVGAAMVAAATGRAGA